MHPPYERPVRRCLDQLPATTRAAWRTRYLADDGAEMRAIAALERVEATMRTAGDEVTIRTVWIALAERATAGAGPDIAAAAALAGLAMGLTAA